MKKWLATSFIAIFSWLANFLHKLMTIGLLIVCLVVMIVALIFGLYTFHKKIKTQEEKISKLEKAVEDLLSKKIESPAKSVPISDNGNVSVPQELTKQIAEAKELSQHLKKLVDDWNQHQSETLKQRTEFLQKLIQIYQQLEMLSKKMESKKE